MSRCAVFRSERMYMYGYRVFWYQDASGQRHNATAGSGRSGISPAM